MRVVVASKLTDAEKALIEELWSLGLPERAIGREVAPIGSGGPRIFHTQKRT